MDEAPIGLYTKLRKTETFEMDVMQKLHVGSFQTLHTLYLHMVACTNINKSTPLNKLAVADAIWARMSVDGLNMTLA